MTNIQVSRKFADGAHRGSSNSMFIDGNIIYSYGYHFPIARIVNDNTVLFTNRGYSNTTAKHKSNVLNALMSNNYRIITVNNVTTRNKEENMKLLETDLTYLKEKQKRARKTDYSSQIQRAVKNINEYKGVTL